MISKKNRKKNVKKTNKRQKGGNRCVKTENLIKMLCKESYLDEISQYLIILKNNDPINYYKLIDNIGKELKYIDIQIEKSKIKKKYLEKLLNNLERMVVMRGGGMIFPILIILIAYLFYKYNLLDVFKQVVKNKGSPMKLMFLFIKLLRGKLIKPKSNSKSKK